MMNFDNFRFHEFIMVISFCKLWVCTGDYVENIINWTTNKKDMLVATDMDKIIKGIASNSWQKKRFNTKLTT